MSALRTGVDLVEVERLTELRDEIRLKFLTRVFTEGELERAAGANEILAELFAAKEAVVKALGCGIGPVSWREIEINQTTGGDPMLSLSGGASLLADQMGLGHWCLSLSHTADYAVALVIAYSAETG